MSGSVSFCPHAMHSPGTLGSRGTRKVSLFSPCPQFPTGQSRLPALWIQTAPLPETGKAKAGSVAARILMDRSEKGNLKTKMVMPLLILATVAAFAQTTAPASAAPPVIFGITLGRPLPELPTCHDDYFLVKEPPCIDRSGTAESATLAARRHCRVDDLRLAIYSHVRLQDRPGSIGTHGVPSLAHLAISSFLLSFEHLSPALVGCSPRSLRLCASSS
jgi:hypothetical protein